MFAETIDRLRGTEKNQWTVNKYDQFDRLLYSGLITDESSRETMKIHHSSIAVNESYTGNGPVAGYTSSKLTPSTLLTVNYYDNYSFLSYTDNNPGGQLTNTSVSGYTTPSAPAYAKTMLTGTRVYHLDDPAKFEVTALYYDKYGRVVQTRATNHLGGFDITYNDLDFTGKPNKTLKTHGINGNASTYTELYTYAYDKERLLSTSLSLNGGAAVTLIDNVYDNLGRLQTKTLGGIDATTYTYNIRSWVSGISGNRFTENLCYNQNTANIANFTACYNGNISGIQWSIPAEGQGQNRAYSFAYDELNRLTESKYTGGTVGAYNESFAYDKMGNTTNLVRYGVQSATGMTFGKIDDLVLEHTGNQLTKVTDYGNDGVYYGNEEFIRNTANSGNSCAYDANGNRLYDSNSNVWAIKYNVLNRPDAMQFYQGHQTNYTYSAAGVKLKVVDKTAPEGVTLPVSSLNTILSNPSVASTTTTDYAGNYIYENGTLKRILLPEGYWQGGYYYYYLKDHLGSNRVVLRNDGYIAETSNYYPSGMRFGESIVNGGNVQPYRHTGHEMQAMHGLNWIDNNARFRTVSDGGGFTGVDPLAEKYYWITPYAYCLNNPVKFVDTDGRYPTRKIVDNGHIGSRFGPRIHPITGRSTMHNGQDFPAQVGSQVHAAAEGDVIKVGYQYNSKKKTGWGHYVQIKHKDGTITQYSHLKEGSINVKEGAEVKDGEVFAASGKSGGVTGPHLDFEIIQNGKPINPLSIDDLQKDINKKEGAENLNYPNLLKEVVVVAEETNNKNAAEQQSNNEVPPVNSNSETKNQTNE